MKADFESLSVVIGLLGNTALLATLVAELNGKELTQLAEGLRADLGIRFGADRPTRDFIERKRSELLQKLFSWSMVALHVAYVVLLLALALVLIIGPQKIFSSAEGELAEPLTSAEFALYWAWFAISLLIYLVSGFSPTFKLWRLSHEAKEWLDENGTPPRTKRN